MAEQLKLLFRCNVKIFGEKRGALAGSRRYYSLQCVPMFYSTTLRPRIDYDTETIAVSGLTFRGEI
jgi:hypothetical protein